MKKQARRIRVVGIDLKQVFAIARCLLVSFQARKNGRAIEQGIRVRRLQTQAFTEASKRLFQPIKPKESDRSPKRGIHVDGYQGQCARKILKRLLIALQQEQKHAAPGEAFRVTSETKSLVVIGKRVDRPVQPLQGLRARLVLRRTRTA